MPPRAPRSQAGIEEFADLVAARIIAFLMAPRVIAPAGAHLSTEQLSAEIGVPAETLRDWRKDGKGPKYIRGESRGAKATILYRRKDVEAWEEEQLVDPAGRATA
jgi:hypothetical protein